MSHHGSNPFDPEKPAGRIPDHLRKLLMDTASFRGAIGDFPHGQLTKSDEGSIQFAIGEKDGKVVIDFGTPVAWIGLTAQDAADIGSALLKRARQVARSNGQSLSVVIDV